MRILAGFVLSIRRAGSVCSGARGVGRVGVRQRGCSCSSVKSSSGINSFDAQLTARGGAKVVRSFSALPPLEPWGQRSLGWYDSGPGPAASPLQTPRNPIMYAFSACFSSFRQFLAETASGTPAVPGPLANLSSHTCPPAPHQFSGKTGSVYYPPTDWAKRVLRW